MQKIHFIVDANELSTGNTKTLICQSKSLSMQWVLDTHYNVSYSKQTYDSLPDLKWVQRFSSGFTWSQTWKV